MADEKDNKIYGVGDLANFFRVSKKTIWEWCKKGKLPAFKIGKEWRVRVGDLHKVINQKISSKKQSGSTLF